MYIFRSFLFSSLLIFLSKTILLELIITIFFFLKKFINNYLSTMEIVTLSSNANEINKNI